MLGRMQADVIELGSKIMVFLGGTNDLARGVSLQAIRQNLSSIMDLAQAHDIVPIMGSILPVSDHHAETDPRYSRTADRPPADIVALNEWLKQECVKRSIPYLDYYSAVVDEKGMLRADLSDDGLHPNTEGYKIMAPLAQKLVDAESAKGSKDRGKRKKRFGVF
jgi:lysophospholipase L1-like esterase